MSHKPWNVAALKKYFQSVCFIDTTCFDECFLFHVISGRHFLYKFIVSQNFGATATAFFGISVLKEVHILCLLSAQLHYNAANIKGSK